VCMWFRCDDETDFLLKKINEHYMLVLMIKHEDNLNKALEMAKGLEKKIGMPVVLLTDETYNTIKSNRRCASLEERAEKDKKIGIQQYPTLIIDKRKGRRTIGAIAMRPGRNIALTWVYESNRIDIVLGCSLY